MSYRKIQRNIVKRFETGNNRIQHTWRNIQIKCYGEQAWVNMYRACVGKISQDEIYL